MKLTSIVTKRGDGKGYDAVVNTASGEKLTRQGFTSQRAAEKWAAIRSSEAK